MGKKKSKKTGQKSAAPAEPNAPEAKDSVSVGAPAAPESREMEFLRMCWESETQWDDSEKYVPGEGSKRVEERGDETGADFVDTLSKSRSDLVFQSFAWF